MVVDILVLVLVRMKAATFLKVREVACINYFIVKMLTEGSRLRNFPIVYLAFKSIDLILYQGADKSLARKGRKQTVPV